MRASGSAFTLCRAMALTLVLDSSSARAQDGPADILFGRPHLSGLPSGSEVTYRLERRPSDTVRLGEPFSDDIKLVVRSVAASGGSDVDLRISQVPAGAKSTASPVSPAIRCW